jgi:hypothetical protein
MINDTIRRLHSGYIPFRYKNVPFPVESVLVWYFLLAVQKNLNISGNVLELGVQHGGTAFLEAVSLAPDETLTLIDFKISEQFSQMQATLPDRVKTQIIFHETKTTSPELDDVGRQSFRFIHIDAGHSFEDVCADFKRFSGCLADDGLLCMDDVFEIRWPGVTEAVFKMVPDTDLVPVFFANRKLYLARRAFAQTYIEAFEKELDVLAAFGQLRSWREPMLGGTPLLVKLQPASNDLISLSI